MHGREKGKEVKRSRSQRPAGGESWSCTENTWPRTKCQNTGAETEPSPPIETKVLQKTSKTKPAFPWGSWTLHVARLESQLRAYLMFSPPCLLGTWWP